MSESGQPDNARTRRSYAEVRALILKAYLPLLVVFSVAAALLASSVVVGLATAVLLAMAICGGLWVLRRHVWPRLSQP
jgi:hypothetical protein